MTAADADAGFFGPDSVTWRVHSEPVLFLGGLRALLLQALHPRAMHGVAEHSNFREDAWGRLQRTGEFVGVVNFGTRAEAERAGARVRGIHNKLRSTDPDTGLEYRLSEPELLLWVHCCEVDSFLSTAQRAGLALSVAEADRYVDEQRVAARLVGLDPEQVPASVVELADYFTAVRPQLRATGEARETLLVGLLPPMPGWVQLATPARPAWAGAVVLAFAMMPRWARRAYSLPGLPTTDLAASVCLAGLRVTLRALPESLRRPPHLREARRRLGLDTAA